jgi:hypothetical protein
MNLQTATQLIRMCRDRMTAAYMKPVFDEWVVVELGTSGAQVLDYDGPRGEAFRNDLHADSAALVREMQDRHYTIGDFEFVQQADGSSYDACIRLGEKTYLLCNHTAGTMADLRKDPRWLKAQAPFVDLTEKFRADPLG